MKIDFEVTTEYGVYRDALHLADDHSFTESELEVMKQERVTNWLAIVNAPAVETAPAEQAIPVTVSINGEDYTKVDGTPTSGAKLVEVNGTWYQKV